MEQTSITDLRKKVIGKRIFDLREDCKLRRQDIADHLNVKYNTVSNWETGEHDIKFSDAIELSEFYSRTVSDLSQINILDYFAFGVMRGFDKREYLDSLKYAEKRLSVKYQAILNEILDKLFLLDMEEHLKSREGRRDLKKSLARK